MTQTHDLIVWKLKSKMPFFGLKSKQLLFWSSRWESTSLPFPTFRSHLHSLACGSFLQRLLLSVTSPHCMWHSHFSLTSTTNLPRAHSDDPRWSPSQGCSFCHTWKAPLPQEVPHPQAQDVDMSFWGQEHPSASCRVSSLRYTARPRPHVLSLGFPLFSPHRKPLPPFIAPVHHERGSTLLKNWHFVPISSLAPRS